MRLTRLSSLMVHPDLLPSFNEINLLFFSAHGAQPFNADEQWTFASRFHTQGQVLQCQPVGAVRYKSPIPTCVFYSQQIVFQLTVYLVLSCSSEPSTQIRVIANDGVIPLSPIKGCSADIKSGMCSVDTFVGGMKDVIAETDWSWDCHGDWNVPEGDEWTTVIGSPPSRDAVI